MTTRCSICGDSVYSADPQINLDGKVFHRQCAKCFDCKCQITVDNFSKVEGSGSGNSITLFCSTHYLKRFGESGGAYLDGDRFKVKAGRDVLKNSVLEKASQPEFKAVDGLVTRDIPEGLKYQDFASSFSEAMHQTNSAVVGAANQDFPFDDALPLEARRKSLQSTPQRGPGKASDFPYEDAADVDTRRKSLQTAYSAAGSNPSGMHSDFPYHDALPVDARKRQFSSAGGDLQSVSESPSSTPSTAFSPPLPPPTIATQSLEQSQTDIGKVLQVGFSVNLSQSERQRNGFGEFRSPTGSFFQGDFQGDLMNGKGRLEMKNGSIYEGQFLNSKFHGHGHFSSCHGYSYEGEWFDGKMHGQGRYTYWDGRIVVGQWINDSLMRGVDVFPDL